MVATVTTGWHYIVDIVAGIIVVAISVLGAKAFSAWEEQVESNRLMATVRRRPLAGACATTVRMGRKG